MCKLIFILFYAFMALNRFGSMADSQNSSPSMCILTNKSIECGEFDSKCVLPINSDLRQKNLNKVNENQDHIKTLLKGIPIKKEIKENTTKILQKLIPQDLHHRLAKIENKLKLLQKSLEIQQKIILQNRKIQKMMNIKLKTINQLIPQPIEQSLVNMKLQVSASQKDIHFQLTKMLQILSKLKARQRFQAIGLKFYYIEDNVTQNWTTAAHSCRQMGGHLASIQSNQEFQAIKRKINPDHVYWVDINDHNRKGEFISVASGERVTFFKWLPGEPIYDDDTQRYVNLFNGGMRVENGSNNRNFICQLDDED